MMNTRVMSLTVLGLLAALTLSSAANAAALTQDEAAARVRAEGFTLIAKTEPAPASGPDAIASWDVWASKYGIAYRVTVDAMTGDLTGATPAVEND